MSDLSYVSDTGDTPPRSPNSPLLRHVDGSPSPRDELRKSTRRAELERKRLKLEKIKEQKKIREQERLQLEVENSKTKERRLSTEIDELLLTWRNDSTDDVKKQSKQARSVSEIFESRPEDTKPEDTFVNITSQKIKNLAAETVCQLSIPPKEYVSYSKGTQTNAARRQTTEEIESPIPQSPPSSPHKMPHVEFVYPALIPGEELLLQKEIPEFTEEDKQNVLMSAEFLSFFDKASKFVEQAITEDAVDIFIDYSGRDREDQEGNEKSKAKLSLLREFCDDHWSKGRTVTSLDWSTEYPEWLLASYNNNEDAPNEPDGVVLVWNGKFKTQTPEHVFHCQSQIMTAKFAKFHPNLILGGTYCGQIVLWDNRSGKQVPVQRSPLSVASHTHPVYCVKVVGISNAHNLISISTDGKLCSWSLDMLSAPIDSMVLLSQQTKAIAVTCMSFQSEDVNNFVIGSEEGVAYTACRQGSKAGIVDLYQAHQGPITGIDFHNSQGQSEFSKLFLTSSFDWTIKLWSVNENKPLYSFEDNGDYVFDVSWSPIHPALFATVDGMGRLDIWNLNNDPELPSASTLIDSNIALNCLLWTESGRQIAVGDDLGKIHLYEVEEGLAVPNKDQWSDFEHTLQDLKDNPETDVDTSNSTRPTDSSEFLLNFIENTIFE